MELSTQAAIDDFWRELNNGAQIRAQFEREIGKEDLEKFIRAHEDLSSPTKKFEALKKLAEERGAAHALGMTCADGLKNHAEAEAIWRQLLQNNPLSKPNLAALSNLASQLNNGEKWVEAEPILRATIPLLELGTGMDSPQTLGCIRELYRSIWEQGRTEEAGGVMRDLEFLVNAMQDEKRRAEEQGVNKKIGPRPKEEVSSS